MIAANLADDERALAVLVGVGGIHSPAGDGQHPTDLAREVEVHPQRRRHTLREQLRRIAPRAPIDRRREQLARRPNVFVAIATVPADVQPALPATHVDVVVVRPTFAVGELRYVARRAEDLVTLHAGVWRQAAVGRSRVESRLLIAFDDDRWIRLHLLLWLGRPARALGQDAKPRKAQRTSLNAPSNVYAFPFSVIRSIIFSPLRILQGLPSFDVIVAFVSLPPSQVMATSKPPRAHRPLIDPFG